MRTLLALLAAALPAFAAEAPRPNIVLILADDLGFSDLGCYGSEIATPNLDKLAAGGVRFTHFTNNARCCPTRASLLTGLYSHQVGVGHMLADWKKPAYTTGLQPNGATIGELLGANGYRCYHSGKWHVGMSQKEPLKTFPMDRGFHHTYTVGGGANYFAPKVLFNDREAIKPGEGYYVTDAFTDAAIGMLNGHTKDHAAKPFFLHVCYTSPHFPLQAPPADIAKYRKKYLNGWDDLREKRFAKQKELGIVPKEARLSERHKDAVAWDSLDAATKDDWDLRMAIYAGMIDHMDRSIGKLLTQLKAMKADENTLILFLSDNGSSAEALDTWPNPDRGHKPGSEIGSKESHKCLEVGWANAANTPFRENKMWVHEGGITTPMIAHWPKGITKTGTISTDVHHIIDVQPTFLELAEAKYPAEFQGRKLTPLEGISLVKSFNGELATKRTIAWEHEGNRAIRLGRLKLVAAYKGEWELYDLSKDRTETNNLAAKESDIVRVLAYAWQKWADRVGVVPWSELPGSSYKPTAGYRKTSEAVK